MPPKMLFLGIILKHFYGIILVTTVKQEGTSGGAALYNTP